MTPLPRWEAVEQSFPSGRVEAVPRGSASSCAPFYIAVTILLRARGTLCYDMATRRATMKISRPTKPRFFWQGLLIVLPVVVLAGVGLFSLRQDQAMARREAVEKAQAYADQIAETLWRELTDPSRLVEFSNHTFRLDAQGRLLDPSPAPTVPLPQTLDLSALSESQLRLWRTLQSEADEARTRSNAIAAGRELLATHLLPPLPAQVQYRLGLLQESVGHRAEAAAAWDTVISNHPDAVSEAGLPLAPLAEWRRLQLPSPSNTNLAAALETFCARLMERPSFLTPRLLEEVSSLQRRSPELAGFDAGKWLERWRNQEARRALAAAALAQAKPPVFSNVTSVAMLHSNTSPVPKVFWFHALDLNTDGQRAFPPARAIIGSSQGRGPFHRNRVNNLSLTNAEAVPDDWARATSAPSHSPRDVPRFWLATRHEDGTGAFVVACRVMGAWSGLGGRGIIISPNWTEIRDSLPKLPEWLGYSIELAGETLVSAKELEEVVLAGSESKGSGPYWRKRPATKLPEILSSASRFEQGTELLRVNLHLVAPELLYYRQRTRSLLFGGLIAASALAAIVGFISARRAFLRQQQLSEMKSNFVSSVSHELRAPIASVRLLAESLERGTISEPARQYEYFRFIVQECRRLSSLIENVLDFARIEQGRKQYEFEPTDLPALLCQTVKLMEPAAAEKQIELRLELGEAAGSEPGVSVSVDASAIQQAVINLIDNALKHSPNGSTVITALKITSRDGAPISESALAGSPEDRAGLETGAPGSMVEISVTDHGPGIPPSEHEKIFERFYRRGSELRRETQGVGIGLSIVKHIVEAHGGRVRVESEVGEGSRFMLELPLNSNGGKA